MHISQSINRYLPKYFAPKYQGAKNSKGRKIPEGDKTWVEKYLGAKNIGRKITEGEKTWVEK